MALLEVLAAAGACFDCASEAEIAAVQGCGVSADRIIFANACKRPSDIRCSLPAILELSLHKTFVPCVFIYFVGLFSFQSAPAHVGSPRAELPRRPACT